MSTFDEDKAKKRIEELHALEEEDLVRVLAQAKYNLPYIDLSRVAVENEALRQIEEKDARVAQVAAFKLSGQTIHVAIRTPANDMVGQIKADLEQKGFSAIFYMASLASLEKAWARYTEMSFASASRVGGLDIASDTLIEIGKEIKTTSDIPRVVNELSHDSKTQKVSRMLEVILAGAIAIKASDIHIEPEEKEVRLRYRLDGLLQDVMMFPHETNRLLNSRIKLISGMKLTATHIAQDGRFSMFFGDSEISMRVSTVPGAYGETIVMRLLDPRSIQVKLEDMGMNDDVYQIMLREIAKPNGMILTTGPTGSGKTTTLYAFLQKIYTSEINIITIEDPIEYHLNGITQTQVDHKKGYDFLAGLRAALRQDPEVVMVGEIRDPETAKIAVEAALTGHVVFSTLHTNNAAGVIPRLIDLDVNPKILPSALTLSIAQRLIRKLCVHCKKERAPTEDEKKIILQVITDGLAEGKNFAKYSIDPQKPFSVWEPGKCIECNNTGYKGRIGLFEVIETTPDIEKIMPQNPSEREIKDLAEKQGTLDMKEDAVVKILKGVTSFDEAKSVVDFFED